MADHRITVLGAMVETVDDTNYRRLTTLGAMIETLDDTNYRRITSLGVMVEYVGTPTPVVTAGTLPPIQIVG